MRTDRILNERLYRYLTTSSDTRDYLIELVRQRIHYGAKSVALCFRGDYVTLYYRSHQLLRIRSSYGEILAEFDFRHARFTNSYKQILDNLLSLGVDISCFSDDPGYPHRKFVRFYLTGAKSVTVDSLAKIMHTYVGLIDDFLDPTKDKYAFDRKDYRIKSSNTEKDCQQLLFAKYFLQDNLTYYDLEYAEYEAVKGGVHGRFDLLGLRREGDGYTLLFTELKSTANACSGKSGIIDHEIDYLHYLDSPFMANRKREACATVRLLCEIFDKPAPNNLTPDNIQNVKIKFVFSDRAIRAGERYVPQDSRIEKVYLSADGTEQPY